MSQEDFERFRQLVLEDRALQEKLREPSDQKVFVDLVIQLGREHGCDFSGEEVERAVRAWRRVWIERWISA